MRAQDRSAREGFDCRRLEGVSSLTRATGEAYERESVSVAIACLADGLAGLSVAVIVDVTYRLLGDSVAEIVRVADGLSGDAVIVVAGIADLLRAGGQALTLCFLRAVVPVVGLVADGLRPGEVSARAVDLVADCLAGLLSLNETCPQEQC